MADTMHIGNMDNSSDLYKELVSTPSPDSGGGSGSGDGSGGFFDTYYSVPRFSVETILAILAIACNLATVSVLRHVHGSHTAYHRLFVNLAVADILASVLSWICNNVLYLFRAYISYALGTGSITFCEFFVYMLAGVFACSAFGIVSTITMLGFTVVQYFAICNPLHHQSIVRKGRICVFLLVAWLVSIISAMVPFLATLLVSRQGVCDARMLEMILFIVILGSNVSIAIVGVAFVITVVMCARIYWEIRSLQRRLSQFRFDQSVSGERKAFVTIMILLATLTTFYIPYAVIFVITLNTSSQVDMDNWMLIYYMTLLPYLKFVSDPIIYGMRMREAREGMKRTLTRCGLGRCVGEGQELISTQQPTTSIVVTSCPAMSTL